MGKLERFWDGALEKVRREGLCRVCGSQLFLQCAHVVGRKHDPRVELESGEVAIFVDPLDVVPLCETCHRDYDARRLSLLEHLSYAEQAAAVEHLGIVRALHRLSGNTAVPTPLA